MDVVLKRGSISVWGLWNKTLWLIKNENHNEDVWHRELRKWGGSRKLAFSDRELKITDIGDFGCSKFQFCPKFPQNGGFRCQTFSFSRNFWRMAKIKGGQLSTRPPPPCAACHNITIDMSCSSYWHHPTAETCHHWWQSQAAGLQWIGRSENQPPMPLSNASGQIIFVIFITIISSSSIGLFSRSAAAQHTRVTINTTLSSVSTQPPTLSDTGNELLMGYGVKAVKSSVADWGGGMSGSWKRHGSNCLLMLAMDGRIVRYSIISPCQSAATSEIVKRFWSRTHVRSTITSIATFREKNGHWRFLLHLPRKCLDLYKIFRERLRRIKHSIDVEAEYSLSGRQPIRMPFANLICIIYS